MQETYSNKHLNDSDNQINYKEIFYALLDGKWLIVSITSLVSVLGVIFSLSLPNIYESKALLVPVNGFNNTSSSIRNYAGLLNLASPVNASSNNQNNTLEALDKLRSLSFFEKNFITNIHLPDLMAVKFWDTKTNNLIFDESVYDANTKNWVRDFAAPKQQIPSAQESFKVFKSKHLNLVTNEETGFITLSIKHQSPFVAKQWVELIVNEVNTFYREKDKSEAEKSVSYLNQQILMTGLSEIKQVLAQLLQEEIKKLTLIEANEYYVFDYIDPPAVMEIKSGPSRSLICIAIAILGGMLSIIIALIKYFIFNKKTA